MKKFIFIIACSLSSMMTMAQQETTVQQLLNEVYPADMITEHRINKAVENWSRISIVKASSVGAVSAVPLSSIQVRDKYKNVDASINPATFNPETFNPFKYFLNFYPQSVVYYAIDNTAYLIKIDPKP